MKKLLLFLLLSVPAFGVNTYYIDFVGGNDANNGTAKGTPWKHQPYMKGFTGSYAHANGDQFIFKGGVTWDKTCLTWVVTTASSASGTPDYYGVDMTWFTGGSWTRPIISAGGADVADGTWGDSFMRINIGSSSYMTVDNLNFTGLFWNQSSTGNIGYIDAGGSDNILVENVYTHGWSHGTFAAGTRDNAYSFTGNSGPGNPGNSLQNVICDGTDTTEDSMGCVYYFAPKIQNSTAHDMTNGVITGSISLTISGNTIYNINNSFDSTQHENGLETFDHDGATDLIYQNYIHDVVAGVTVKIDPCIGTGVTVGITDYVYDNVIYGSASSAPIPLQVDTCDAGTVPVAATQALLYNNTIVTNATQSCIRSIARANPISQLTIENTHCITVNSLDVEDAGSVTTVTRTTNTTMTPTTATSQGYVAGNQYAPTLVTNSTVAAGTTVICSPCTNIGKDILGNPRPAGSGWDTGAYQFVNTQAQTPTFSPVAGTYVGTQSVTISSLTGGATLCYTTDNSTPTANGAGTCTHGTTYSTAVSVAVSETLKAIASESGLTDSGVGSAAYVITSPPATHTVFSGGIKFSGGISIK